MKPVFFFQLLFLSIIFQTPSKAQEVKNIKIKNLIKLSKKSDINRDSLSTVYYLLSTLYYYDNRLDTAYFYATKSISFASEMNNYKALSHAYYVLGNIYYYKNEFREANKNFNTALTYSAKQNDSILTADILIDKAYTHDIISERDSALEMLEKAVEISKKTGYLKGVGKAEIASGNIYYGINDFDTALIHYKGALKAAKTINNAMGMGTSYKNIAAVYLEKKQYNKTIKNLKLSEIEYKKTKNLIVLSNIYNDFAIIYSKKQETDSVLNFLQKSMQLSKKYGTKEDVAVAYNIAAESYRNLKNFKISNIYLDSCIAIAEDIKYGLMLQKSYQTYSNNFYSLKDYQYAFKYYTKYTSIKDSLLSESFQNRLAQYETEYQTAKKEKEIIRLKDKELLEKANTRLLIIGIISLIIIFILIIIRIQTKRKKDSEIQRQKILVHQKEKELVKAKLEQKEIEEKRLKNELEFKTKKLVAHALNMMQKNKLLQEISNHISAQANTLESEERKHLFHIKKQLEKGLNIDKDWDLFKIYFEQLNKSFFVKLKEINPKLTGNDFRLCALTKLNLSLKETASVLNISPESAKNARYRLKKKLKLKEGENLNRVINSL
ncbi:MAG: tetratricopeptide repeat protein [Chlorobi bacterium]|nr:tetratricopeptide repeat protein [Chlorobiota bacterium]